MPYNFETASGDLYFGNQLLPGLAPYLDANFPQYANLPEWAYPSAGGGTQYIAQPFTGFATDVSNTVKNVGQGIADTVQAGNTLTTGLGILSGGLGLAIFVGGAYLVAKNQKWLK